MQKHSHQIIPLTFYRFQRAHGRCGCSLFYGTWSYRNVFLKHQCLFCFCFVFPFGILILYFRKRYNRASLKSPECKYNSIDKIWKELNRCCDLRQIRIYLCTVLLFGALLQVKNYVKIPISFFVQNWLNCKYFDFKLSISYSIFYPFFLSFFIISVGIYKLWSFIKYFVLLARK